MDTSVRNDSSTQSNNASGSQAINISSSTSSDTLTQTLTASDSWNAFSLGSFIGGSWSLTSVSSGDSYSDNYTTTQTDSATQSGTRHL